MLVRSGQTRYEQLALGLLLLFLSLQLGTAPAMAQSNPPLDDEEAQRHLDLGEMYESNREWDLALQEYLLASQAESSQISSNALSNIERVTNSKRSFPMRLLEDLDEFSVWAASNTLKLALALLVTYLFIRLLVRGAASRRHLSILPFNDFTDNNLGVAVSENIVSLIHEARATHLSKAAQSLSILEAVEIPSVRARSQSDALVSSLKSLDTFDLSGFGLPIGSLLSSVMQWLDIGSPSISGAIHHRGNTVFLTAQLHKGRSASATQVWSLGVTVDQEELGAALLELERALAFRILFDIQSGWGASSAESLRLFTQAMQQVNLFEGRPVLELSPLKIAADLLNRALEIDPNYTEACYNLALVQHNLGNHERAIDLLKSLNANPAQLIDLGVAYNLGAAYYNVLTYSSYDIAERYFQNVVADLQDTSLSKDDRAVLALSYCGLANIAAQRMDYDGASKEEHYLRAQENYASALEVVGDVSSHIVATAHTAMGIAHGNADKTEQAIALFEQAIRAKPEYWRAFLHWGRVERNGGSLDRSIILLQKAAQLNPSNQFIFFQLGVSLKKAGRSAEALDAFRKAHSIPQALCETGTILAEEFGNYLAALDYFERALVLNQELDDAKQNLVWYTAEAGLTDEGRLSRIAALARETAEGSVGNANEWHRRSLLGRILLMQGLHDDALHELKRSIELQPTQPQSHFFLAQLYLQQNDLEQARAYLASFLEHRSKSKWYQDTYPVAVELMQRTTEA